MELQKQLAQDAHTQEQKNTNDASVSQSIQMDAYSTASTAGGQKELTDAHKKILQERGITLETATKFGLTSSHEGGKDWLVIPYFMEGKLVNRKFRTLGASKEFRQDKGARKCFWNADAIKDCDELVITEGELDALIAIQCGYNAISVPDGAPKESIEGNSVKYDYLSDIPLTSPKNIILAVDSDAAGSALLHDLSIRLGKHRCLWVKYPQGCKDLNETFVKYGKRGVDAVFEKKQYVKVDGLYKMSELPPVPTYEAYDVGISGLEAHMRLRRGDLSVLTGIPSHGKSTFVNNLCFNMAEKHHWHVTFASFEQPPQTEHRYALRTLFTCYDHKSQTPEQRKAADSFIEERFSFIVPDDDTGVSDLNWLLEMCAAAVTRNNSAMIVIDPWNEMEHTQDKGETLTQYVGRAIKDLKRFARLYKVHVMVVAHPAKMRRNKDGEFPIPDLYDISDSAHWYNKPDQGFVVHRDGDTTIFRVAKSRYHATLGKPAEIKLSFNPNNGRYSKEY